MKIMNKPKMCAAALTLAITFQFASASAADEQIKKAAETAAVGAAVEAVTEAAGQAKGAKSLLRKTPSCVLMKFTDDTRFKPLEANEVFSDLVMEKMIASGRFTLMEMRPIDQDMEAMLYDEKMREVHGAQAAMEEGDFSALFEGPGYSETKAQSIASAEVGQIVTPSVTSEIGRTHKAEYLLQGTIINLGNGAWMNPLSTQLAGMASNIASQALSQALSSIPVVGAVLGMALSSMELHDNVFGVESDLRVIRADTGEVVWAKRVKEKSKSTSIKSNIVSAGESKVSANLYNKAMDKAAQSLVDALLEDMDNKKLFAE